MRVSLIVLCALLGPRCVGLEPAAEGSDPQVCTVSTLPPVRRIYDVERDSQNNVTKTTLRSEAVLSVVKNEQGRIEVGDDPFLQKVPDCTALQGLYKIP